MDSSTEFESNPSPSPVFGLIDSQAQPSNDPNRNSLTNFVFNFILYPFKAVASRFNPNSPSTHDHPQADDHQLDHHPRQDQAIDPESTDHPTSVPTTNHALSQFFARKGDQPLSDIETRGVMALIQDSRKHLPHPRSPTSSIDTSLPTAFMPNFPSLSRPCQPPRVTSSLPPSSSAPSFPASAHRRRSASRTYYIGPGHSLMNPSSRLSMARRKRLGATQAIRALSNGYDDLLRHPEPPKMIQPNPELIVPAPKKLKLNDQPTPDDSSKTIAVGTPSDTVLPAPRRTIDHSHLSVIKNATVTPIRPSPLRNFTLPASSPSPQRPNSGLAHNPTPPSTPLPKKRKSKQADSIMFSVMKEVNSELHNRTPATSPIKPSEVINPYSNLQRPIRHKRPVAARPVPAANTINPQLNESRNRKVQVCLEGNHDDFNHLDVTDHQHGSNSSKNPLENMLQQIMPEEFRPTTRDTQSKRKTAQLGQLPERVLKKQRLREQQKLKSSGLSITQPNHRDKNLSEPSRSSTISQCSPGEDNLGAETSGSPQNGNLSHRNNLANSKIPVLPSSGKNFNHSSSFQLGKSTFGSSNSQAEDSARVADDVTQRITPKPPGVEPFSMARPPSTTNSPLSSASTAPKTTGQGPDWPKVTRTYKALTTPITTLISSHTLTINGNHKAPSGGNATTGLESTSQENKEKVAQEREQNQERIDESQAVKDRANALSIAEIQKHFNHNLLVDYTSPAERHYVPNSHCPSDYQGIKQTVLGFNTSELETFVLL